MQAPIKDKGDCRRDHPITMVNATKIAKKDKDKAKNRSHIKYYICKQKDYYANKCPKSKKTSDSLGNLYINDYQENEKRIRIGTLHLISYHL